MAVQSNKIKTLLSLTFSLVKFLALTIFLFILYFLSVLASLGAIFPLFQFLYGCFIAAILVSFIAFVIKKKKSFIAALKFVAVMALVPASPLILQNSGFCWKERGWLSEEDVVLTFLSIDKSGALKSRKIRDDVSLESCRVIKKYTNGLTRLYDLECYSFYDNNTDNPNELKYYFSLVSIDTCGKEVESMGEGFREKERYEAGIKRNKEYWRK